MPHPEYIALLDIGASKIVCAVIQHKDTGRYEWKSLTHTALPVGVALTLPELQAHVLSVISDAESQTGALIETVHMTVLHPTLLSAYKNRTIPLPNHVVESAHLRQIINGMLQELEQIDMVALHFMPQHFHVDGQPHTANPLGMNGSKLSCALHVIAAPYSTIDNYVAYAGQIHVDVSEKIASPYASSLACITEGNRKLGAVLIDCGAAHTALSVWNEGKMIYSCVIPIAGNAITRDIATVFDMDEGHAEALKCSQGTALCSDDQAYIWIDFTCRNQFSSERAETPLSALTAIIRARVSELAEAIAQQLSQASIPPHVLRRILVTGGTAELPGLCDVFSEVFHVAVKRATHALPDCDKAMHVTLSQPSYAALVGLYHARIERGHKDVVYPGQRHDTPHHRMIDGIKRWLHTFARKA